MIQLTRINTYPDRLRAYHVIMDGKKVGTIGNNKTIALEIEPGEHTLKLQIDWCYSNEIQFTYIGEELSFECGSSMRNGQFWVPFVTLYYITIGRKKYITLERKM